MSQSDKLDARIARVAGKIRQRAMNVGSCISNDDLLAFESKYGVSLPDEYRGFLLRIGNEAPGPPAFGLIRLAEPPISHVDYRSHTREEFAGM
jgi:hypothetical protein